MSNLESLFPQLSLNVAPQTGVDPLALIKKFIVCPLSNKIMCDPVFASDGQTYEHCFIVEYVKNDANSPVSPVDQKTALTNVLVENKVMKNMINEFIGDCPKDILSEYNEAKELSDFFNSETAARSYCNTSKVLLPWGGHGVEKDMSKAADYL